MFLTNKSLGGTRKIEREWKKEREKGRERKREREDRGWRN